ncbi:MAG: hypothetical protein P8Z37_01845 [Acidobacteriota bacterium]
MKKPLLAATVILLLAFTLRGSDSAIDRNTVRKGLNELYSLNYPKAWEIFDRLKIEHPENPIAQGMIALTAYNELLFETRNLAVFQYGIPSPLDDIQHGHVCTDALRKENGSCQLCNYSGKYS